MKKKFQSSDWSQSVVPQIEAASLLGNLLEMQNSWAPPWLHPLGDSEALLKFENNCTSPFIQNIIQKAVVF